MKFTAFVLATAAATATAQSAQQQFFNPGAFPGAMAFSPYGFQPYPQQPYPFPQQPYPVYTPPVNVDPLAWERDCTWINSVNFRAALSIATCGAATCQTGSGPNGNGGGASMQATASEKTGFNVWGTVVNRAGRVCAVAYTGSNLGEQFPFGRVQALKRANTANALSIPSRSVPSRVSNNHDFVDFQTVIGTATADQPGSGANVDNAWYGFSHDRFNPGNLDVLYQGAASNYGEACGTNRQDPMCMQKPGGYDYSAGGLALFDSQGILRGAIGVSGDNDCTNHAIAWKTREQLYLNYTPNNKARATFNDVCSATPGANTPCGANKNADNTVNKVSRAHLGTFAEDNVFYTENEYTNFPGCYGLIKDFPTTNPTKAAASATKTA